MAQAEDVGAKWCDHCGGRFEDHDEVDAMCGLFFHPDCPHEISTPQSAEAKPAECDCPCHSRPPPPPIPGDAIVLATCCPCYPGLASDKGGKVHADGAF